jgi:hypothetical protein
MENGRAGVSPWGSRLMSRAHQLITTNEQGLHDLSSRTGGIFRADHQE